MKAIKFISIEYPLKFYGIPGWIFLGVGLNFIIMKSQGFTEKRQILLSTSIIGFCSIIVGTILLLTSIILYTLVTLIKESSDWSYENYCD